MTALTQIEQARTTRPVFLTHAGDGTGRIFVVELDGIVRVYDGDFSNGRIFLDLTNRVVREGELGLLGLAFAPNYATNGRFYVYYTRKEGDTPISRFSRFTVGADPDVADASSEQVLLEIEQPDTDHNGGTIAFGNDGYLYIGMGDGGTSSDSADHGQRTDSLLGKMLRIDVEASGTSTYAIPADNPYASGGPYLPEVWAVGLRNPWRFSFDRQTGEMYIADVGQDAREEINVEPPGAGGRNYGWRITEGTLCFIPNPCDKSGLTLPAFEYNHDFGQSITGGYVYRGGEFPSMQGFYIYGDYISGRVWGLRRINGAWENQELLQSQYGLVSFGEDEAGALYLLNLGGKIYKLVPAS